MPPSVGMRNNITIIGLIVLAALALWIFVVPEFTVYLPSKDIVPGGELIESAPDEFIAHRRAMQNVLNDHLEPFYVNDRGLLMITTTLASNRTRLDSYTREAEALRQSHGPGAPMEPDVGSVTSTPQATPSMPGAL